MSQNAPNKPVGTIRHHWEGEYKYKIIREVDIVNIYTKLLAEYESCLGISSYTPDISMKISYFDGSHITFENVSDVQDLIFDHRNPRSIDIDFSHLRPIRKSLSIYINRYLDNKITINIDSASAEWTSVSKD